VRRKALGRLRDIVAPWELLDGYSSATELMRVAESQIPEMVIPFLIDLLKTSQDKDHILETLYELSRYVYVDDSFILLGKRDSYRDWSRRLREAVCKGLDLYKILQHGESSEVQQAAKDLIKLLTTHKGSLD
jgi:hypothetical protein